MSESKHLPPVDADHDLRLGDGLWADMKDQFARAKMLVEDTRQRLSELNESEEADPPPRYSERQGRRPPPTPRA